MECWPYRWKVFYEMGHTKWNQTRAFTATRPGQVWVSDITYIKTSKGRLYLTVIIDLFDRKVVGWAMSKGLSAEETIIVVWRMAIGNRPIVQKLIFHSDRGIQYACTKFTNILKANKLVIGDLEKRELLWAEKGTAGTMQSPKASLKPFKLNQFIMKITMTKTMRNYHSLNGLKPGIIEKEDILLWGIKQLKNLNFKH